MMRTLDVEICTYGARSPTITSGGVNRVIRFSIIAEKDNERGGQERKKWNKKDYSDPGLLSQQKAKTKPTQSNSTASCSWVWKLILFSSLVCSDQSLQLLTFPSQKTEQKVVPSPLSPQRRLAQGKFWPKETSAAVPT